MAVPFPKSFLPGALLALLLAFPAAGADAYKASLDKSIPHHAAILDTLAKLEKEPGNAQLHNDLGCLIAWDGFWRDALRSFDKAAELDPKDTRPWFNAGLVEALRGEWSAARSKFRKAVKVDPGNWPGWWMLGFAEESLGNEGAAIDAYARSLRVDTSLFDPKVNPFAVGSRLKARVLLETYDRRRVDAAIPFTNQLSQPSRIAGFFQSKTPVVPAGTVEIQEPPKTGPVVMSVAPPSRVPAAAGTPAPGAGETMSRRRRAYGRETDGGVPVEVAPATTRRPPDVSDTPPGPGFGTGNVAPGSSAAPSPATPTTPTTPAPGATPAPRRVGAPGPGGPPAPPPDGQ
jgi:hypothetical protein